MNIEKVFSEIRNCKTVEHLNRIDTWLQDNAPGNSVLTELSIFVEELLTKHKLFLYDEELKEASTQWVANNPFEPAVPVARDSDFRFLPDGAARDIARAVPSEKGRYRSKIVADTNRLTMKGRVIRDKYRRKYATLHVEDDKEAEKIFNILNSYYMKDKN